MKKYLAEMFGTMVLVLPSAWVVTMAILRLWWAQPSPSVLL